MRRIVLAVLILIVPSATAIVVYLFLTKPTPTNRNAIGMVTTIAGAGSPGAQDGSAQSASFSDPFGIAVDRRGNVIVADAGQNNRIRRITVDGKVQTIAGSAEGFADGVALQAQFNTPSGIVIDPKGNIVIADTSNNRVRKLSKDGATVTTIAGTGEAGLHDGPSAEAKFDGPIGIAVDRHGNLFIADAYNDSIRKLTTEGVVSTVAGTGAPGYSDGPAHAAMFDTPSGIAVDRDGNLFVADTGNRAIRKINLKGEVSTLAGKSEGEQGREANLNRPVGIVVTGDGFLFVSDAETGRIIRIAPDGEIKTYAGGVAGFANGAGVLARFNGPSSVAIDRRGVLYVADSQNYLIREIVPGVTAADSTERKIFLQPAEDAAPGDAEAVIPILNSAVMGIGQTFPWPLSPQGSWHEIAGVVGEARGAPGGIALDHLHSGLDISGARGDLAFSVMDEKVSSPISNWGYQEAGEGIRIGLMTYIHLYVGRTVVGPERRMTNLGALERFKPRFDPGGALIGVRVRRGTRFKVGDFIGSLNWLNHVHLNLGPWNAQGNPLSLPFFALKDTVVPTIESIEVVPVGELGTTDAVANRSRVPSAKPVRRTVISGDVAIVVTAFDRVDGNSVNRKLGLFRIGYQVLNADRSPVKGFEQPLMNIEFNRLPAEDSSVFKAFAPGSGISAYGTPTRFRYIVTNRVRDGEALDGLLRTSSLASGDYIIRVIAEDFAGNRPTGPATELAVTIKN
jgi:sugar lactone lactonase YvrE